MSKWDIYRLGGNRTGYPIRSATCIFKDTTVLKIARYDYACIYSVRASGKKVIGIELENEDRLTLAKYARTAEPVMGMERVQILEENRVTLSAHQRAAILREEYIEEKVS